MDYQYNKYYRQFLPGDVLAEFDINEAWALARIRMEGKKPSAEYPNSHVDGAAAELAVSSVTGLEVDWVPRPGGDRGIDSVFSTIGNNTYTVDIKANRWGDFLRVEKRLAVANYYILCYCDIRKNTSQVAIRAWATLAEVLASPIDDGVSEDSIFKMGKINHYIHVETMPRPIDELLACIRRVIVPPTPTLSLPQLATQSTLPTLDKF